MLHALVLGLGLALLFTLLAWTVAPLLSRLLGGEGWVAGKCADLLPRPVHGSVFIWANFFLSALLRGGGDAATPGRCMLISSIAQVPLSYVLALGIGGWPGLGMAGALRSPLCSPRRCRRRCRRVPCGPASWGFVPAVSGIRPARAAVLGHPPGRA